MCPNELLTVCVNSRMETDNVITNNVTEPEKNDYVKNLEIKKENKIISNIDGESREEENKCKQCGKTFKFRKGLEKHQLIHTKGRAEKPYSCGVCGVKFYSASVLQNHTRKKHPEEFPCEKCKRIFSEEDEMKIHSLSHSKVKPFKCGFCDKGFKECSGLLKHLLIHVKDGNRPHQQKSEMITDTITSRARSNPKRRASSNPKYNTSTFMTFEEDKIFNSDSESSDDQYDAPDDDKSDEEEEMKPVQINEECSDTILSNGNIEDIDATVKSMVSSLLSTKGKLDLKGETFVCDICGKEFKVKGYRNHMKTHTVAYNDKKFTCGQCGKCFSKKETMQRHCQTHFGRRHKCEYCGRTYSNNYNLVYHMKIHTGGAQYSCSYCNRLFCSKSQLNYHVTMHTGVKAFTCEICGRDFRLKTMLKSHIKTHAQEKPYMCDICGRKFLFMGSLKKHSMVHTGEKPYACTKCGKTFAAKVSLAQHMNIHTGEGYTCSQCGRRFAQLANLARHKRIHTGSRPYPCTMCTKTFRTSNDKKRHMRIHTGDKPYRCEICGKGFTQSGNLQTHMKVHRKGSGDNQEISMSMHALGNETQSIPQHYLNNNCS